MSNRFAIIDTETTGNQPSRNNRIIQIGIVLIEDNKIIDRFSSFINPGKEIPLFIQQFTGITMNMVKNAPTFAEVSDTIIKLLSDAYFVAHNVPFDLAFIQAELKRNNKKPFEGYQIDTVELARMLYPTADGYQLNQLSERFSIDHDNPHRADSDAEVTAEIFLKMLEKLSGLPLQTLRQLDELSSYFKSDLTTLLQDIMEDYQHPKSNYQLIKGFAINNYVKPNELTCSSKTSKTTWEKWQQNELSAMVYDALHTRSSALLERYYQNKEDISAYFISAIRISVEHRVPVVISTASTFLQKNMIDAIKKWEQKASFPVRYLVSKKRSSYLCLRKFARFMEEETKETNYDLVLTKAQVLIWLTETTDGDLDEINFPSGGTLILHRISHCTSACTGWNRETPCFFERKKKEMESAHIIFISHDFLLQEARKPASFLSSLPFLVIDEGDHLEKFIKSISLRQLSNGRIQTSLEKIGSPENKEFLFSLEKLHNKKQVINSLLFKLEARKMRAKDDVDELFRFLRQLVVEFHRDQRSELGFLIYPVDENEEHYLWKHCLEMAERLHTHITNTLQLIKQLIETSNGKKLSDEWRGLITDVSLIEAELEEILTDIEIVFFSKGSVRWIEIDEKGPLNNAYFYCQDEVFEQELYSFFGREHQTFALLSPALTTEDKSFVFFKEKFGMNRLKVKEISQELKGEDYNLDIVIPESVKNGQSKWSSLTHILRGIKGKALIVCSDLEMVHKTYHSIKAGLDPTLLLLAQGISAGSKEKLLRNFHKFNSAVLIVTKDIIDNIDRFPSEIDTLILMDIPYPSMKNPVIADKYKEKMNDENDKDLTHSFQSEAILNCKKLFDIVIRKSDLDISFLLLDISLLEQLTDLPYVSITFKNNW